MRLRPHPRYNRKRATPVLNRKRLTIQGRWATDPNRTAPYQPVVLKGRVLY